MNILRVRPSVEDCGQQINELAVSNDQCTIKLSSLTTGSSRSFKFDRIFTPSYPISAFYESACLPAVEDVIYRRRSMAIAVLGLQGSGKTYTSIAIVRRALLLALQKVPEGSPVTLRAMYLNEIAPMQEKTILEQSFYKNDDAVAFEKTLGRAVQEYARVQNPNSALLLRVQVKGSPTELKVFDVLSQQLTFMQTLHKHITTKSLVALRESKILQHVRSIYQCENMTTAELQIISISCVDYDIVYKASKYQDTVKQLAFAETLHYARHVQASAIDSILGTSYTPGSRAAHDTFGHSYDEADRQTGTSSNPSVDITVHQETVAQALRVQTVLQDKLKAIKSQLSLMETALSEEKTRNGLRESQLQAEVVNLQSKLEALLAKNFSLEQENKLLKDELVRTKAGKLSSSVGSTWTSGSVGPRQNTVRFLHQPTPTQSLPGRQDAVRPMSAARSTADQEPPRDRPLSFYRPNPAVAAGLALPAGEDEFDAFLLQAATVNRELKNRGSAGF